MLPLVRHYVPFPRQREFHDSNAKYRLFGGAAGPGKTRALLEEAISFAEKAPFSHSLLLRRTFPELESSLLLQFRRDVPRHFYLSYNEAKHVVLWNNGSLTQFGYCRNENDVYQYQGAEYAFIGLDELTHFTLKQWQFLTSRNRSPVYDKICTMAGATNPGNVGHAWVKSLWIDKVPPPGFDRPDSYNPADYHFIPARLEDNPIYAFDDDYRKTLSALPDPLRRAFLEGDWSVLSGQYFDIFEIGRHTARVEDLRLQHWWPRWISIDWGFQHPSAVYWHCAIPPAPPTLASPAGAGNSPPRIATYREFVQNALSPRMLAQAVVERTGREAIRDIYLSPDAFAHRTSESSIAEQLGDVLEQNALPRPSPADDDRVGGWQLMYQLLESDSWVVTDNCVRLLDCIPTLIRDPRRVEDIRKMDGDDPADAARYGLVPGVRLAGLGAHSAAPGAGQSPPLFSPDGSPLFLPGVPLDEQIARHIASSDPTTRAILAQKYEAEARRQFAPRRIPSRTPRRN